MKKECEKCEHHECFDCPINFNIKIYTSGDGGAR